MYHEYVVAFFSTASPHVTSRTQLKANRPPPLAVHTSGEFGDVVKVKVKVKVTLEQTTKDQRGSRGIALLFL
jgi:hypothetical protein